MCTSTASPVRPEHCALRNHVQHSSQQHGTIGLCAAVCRHVPPCTARVLPSRALSSATYPLRPRPAPPPRRMRATSPSYGASSRPRRRRTGHGMPGHGTRPNTPVDGTAAKRRFRPLTHNQSDFTPQAFCKRLCHALALTASGSPMLPMDPSSCPRRIAALPVSFVSAVSQGQRWRRRATSGNVFSLRVG